MDGEQIRADGRNDDGGPVAEAKAYASIGRFVVSFSSLQRHLEIAITNTAGSSWDRGRILLNGERGPEAGRTRSVFQHLVQSYIDEIGIDTDRLSTILKAVCSEIGKLIEFRNDVAHGAWSVGTTSDGVSEFNSMHLIRQKSGGQQDYQRFDAETLLSQAERCELLAVVSFQLGLSLGKRASGLIRLDPSEVLAEVKVENKRIRWEKYDARARARGRQDHLG